MQSEYVIYVPLISLTLGMILLLIGLRQGKRQRLVSDIPTSKTTGVFIGLVEIKGSAESEAPFSSYLAECPCVYYSYSIDEHWSRTVTETYTDSDGKTKTRTRHESGWTNVQQGGETGPFYLQDDCGVVRIQPEGAKIEPVSVFDETCSRSSPLYYGKGPDTWIADSDHRRRFIETAIPLHHQLYVIGQSRERSDAVAPEIAADKDAPLFMISSRTEEQVQSGFRWGYWLLSLFGGLFFLLTVTIFDRIQGRSAPSLILYLMAGCIYGMSWGLGWVWMVYNSMVGLRQRVRQAWSQVDVQLKRRHDLIPNLANAVRGMSEHEKTVQEMTALMRSQSEATPPGQAGPDYAGITPRLMAVVEKYPELTAQESFTNLQKNLVETEQRIALARSYFNEIATHYNTRLEIVPDRWVCQLAGLQPQNLMMANDFERAPVQVNLVI
jgi:hypothetical protein